MQKTEEEDQKRIKLIYLIVLEYHNRLKILRTLLSQYSFLNTQLHLSFILSFVNSQLYFMVLKLYDLYVYITLASKKKYNKKNMQHYNVSVPCERSVLHEGFAGKTLVLRRAAPKPRRAIPLARRSPPRNTYNYIYNAHAEIIYISAEFATIGGN